MNKELALRTFCYLIGFYRTQDETIINAQEIEAIEFMLKINEELEQQCEKQKEVINKAIEYIEENSKTNPNLSGLLVGEEIDKLLDILKGDSNERR